MSKLNGDKARFNRLRRARLLRGERARAAYAALKRQSATGAVTSGAEAAKTHGGGQPKQ